MSVYTLPDHRGKYGEFGGRFVPETLMTAVLELEEEYAKAIEDPEFERQMAYYLKQYIGRKPRFIMRRTYQNSLAEPKFI